MSEENQPPDEEARANRIRDNFMSPHDGIAPNFDAWQEVVNGSETYAVIASELADHQCCIVGWTDCQSTHLDVLFTLSPNQFGSVQGGIRGAGYLFVTIIRCGAFAFKVGRTKPLHSSYIAEKLGIPDHDPHQPNVTLKALTELINGVLEELGQHEG